MFTASRPSASLIACLFALVLVAPGHRAEAQNGPYELPDDHFLCYKGKPDKNLGQILQKGVTTDLDDQFQAEEHGVKKLRGICNPADKNSEGIVDPNTHLTPWAIKSTGAKHVSQTVTTYDQFGRLSLTTAKTERLMIPAAKSLTAPPPWIVSAPGGADHNVDSYQCYKVKITPGSTPFPKGVTVTIDDQFAEPVRTFSVKGPKLFCNPVNVDSGGIKNPEGHRVCYQVKPAKGEAKHAKAGPLQVADAFVAESAVFTAKEDLLCLPALKNPPAEFCGDDVVNQVSEECDGDASVCPGQTDVCLNDCTCAPAARRCGDGLLEPAFGEQCEVDADCTAGQSCSASCTCIDSLCPDLMVMTHYAEVGIRLTDSDNDSGWTGIAHDSEILDRVERIYRISEVSGSGPSSCGVATLSGFDDSARLCRCANDNRTVCDQHAERDVDDCGGAECVCYLDTMSPSLSGQISTCSVTEVVSDPTGSWNLDTGAGNIDIPLDQTTYLGNTVLDPCAHCDGDDIFNDGVRNGVCNGGVNDGESCDAMARSETFPAPGGGDYSLDCFPSGAVIASGLFLSLNYTTDSQNLDVIVPCGVDELELCHCGRCDEDESISCRVNADCASVGGRCGPASSTNPQPNSCSDGVCTDISGGKGQGECQAGPYWTFCDGLLSADGTGHITCNKNADCGVGSLGLDAGNCTVVESRACYPDQITIEGNPDPSEPSLVAAGCIAPSANNPAANIVAGYPGPGLRFEETSTEFRCSGNPAALYPGCN